MRLCCRMKHTFRGLVCFVNVINACFTYILQGSSTLRSYNGPSSSEVTLESIGDYTSYILEEVEVNTTQQNTTKPCAHSNWYRYSDVIMGTTVSQITSLTIAYSTVHSDADKKTHKKTSKLRVTGLCAGHRWIPRTNGQ